MSKKTKHKPCTSISTDKLFVGALTLTTLVTSGIMSSMHVNADDGNNAVVDDTTIIVPTTCSMSGTINEGEEHTATILPGSYKDNIGKTDIKALCNDYNGFSIYAIGYSNNTSGTPSEGNNTMIGQTTNSTIVTGTNDSGDTSNWAMKLTKITDSTITYNPNNLSITNSYDNYNVIPSTLTKVVEYKDTNTNNSSSTDQTKGAHIETTYAAYIASTQPADTYNGKVKYLLVHPANFTTGTYSISYNANGGTGTMDTETGIKNYEPHTLAASTLTAPAGYMLAGWCDTQDTSATAENPQTSCGGTSYAINANIPASTMTVGSTMTLYAVWQQIIEITYNGNGADAATNMDNIRQYTTNVEGISTVDLLVSNFTKAGHGFVGWSEDQDAWDRLTDNNNNNDPIIYGPNQTITVDPAMSTKLVLYAVWAPAETDNNSSPVSLQDWQGCSTLTATTYNSETGALTVGKNTVTALTDARDGNIYTVARLADGNCWMTENLRLDNESEFTATNTNNPSLPLTNNYEGQTKSNYLSTTSNDWCTDSSASCVDQSKLNTNNTALAAASPAFSQDFTNTAHENLNDNINSYGNYYNWYSATAGRGRRSTTSTITGDICPTGWHLPYGGRDSSGKGGNTSGGFYYLIQQMDKSQYMPKASNIWRSFPNNFTYSGRWWNSSMYDRGDEGYYWTYTAQYYDRTYYLILYRSGVDMRSAGKYAGYSVRCVAPAE